jgi:hypothetical protein
MCYLDYVACVMRNRHFGEFWLHVVESGCQLAQRDRTFARVSGAAFGGLDIRPIQLLGRMWLKSMGQMLADSGRIASEVVRGKVTAMPGIANFGRWGTAWWSSLAEDPAWHMRWFGDVTRKWMRLTSTTRLRDPRMRGPAQIRISAPAR